MENPYCSCELMVNRPNMMLRMMMLMMMTMLMMVLMLMVMVMMMTPAPVHASAFPTFRRGTTAQDAALSLPFSEFPKTHRSQRPARARQQMMSNDQLATIALDQPGSQHPSVSRAEHSCAHSCFSATAVMGCPAMFVLEQRCDGPPGNPGSTYGRTSLGVFAYELM